MYYLLDIQLDINQFVSFLFSSRDFDPERDYARMKASGVFKSLGMNCDL